jgi:CrcB protein
MSAAVLVAVGALGGVGAVGRLLVDRAVSARARGPFPFGTLAVNLSGSFALGVLAGAALSGDANRLAATGLLGSYTTFSTWMLESRRLAGGGQRGLAALNVAGSLVLGVGLVWLGRSIGRAA